MRSKNVYHTSAMTTLSIIIVTYNSEKEIGGCLRSVIAQTHDDDEIIVVDNASTDRTVSILKTFGESADVIKCESNTGYARGNNIGFRKARGKYVLLLNPDAVVDAGAIEKMIDYLEYHSEVTVLAPQVCNPDGSPQQSVRHFPDYRILAYELLGFSKLFARSLRFNRWRIPEFDYGRVQEVEQPMAAALMLRRSFFKEQLMDERFVMFFNDVDLCRRVWDGEGKIVFYPDAKVYHVRGASTGKVKERMIPLHTRGFIEYLRKYEGSMWGRVLLELLIPAMILNAMVRVFFNIMGVRLGNRI